MAISAAFSICRVVPPITAVRPPAAIAQAEPTSAWQPPSAPEIDAFALNSEPSAVAVSRKRRMPRRRFASATRASSSGSGASGRRSGPRAAAGPRACLVPEPVEGSKPSSALPTSSPYGRDGVAGAEARVGEEPPPVHRDGGQDAGGTVGRRRDDAATGGVLLVDGEREGAEPLARQLAVSGGLRRLELLADGRRAPLDLEHARQHAVVVQARLDAGGHRVPDARRALRPPRLRSAAPAR